MPDRFTSDERLLVVNADDFGLTPGICDGILRAHAGGIVTSTTVIAVGPALAGRVEALHSSGLATGGHLTLVGEDPPLLSAAEIPTLVDDRGRLAPSWRTFVRRAALGRVDAEAFAARWGRPGTDAVEALTLLEAQRQSLLPLVLQ